eukprot:m.2038 g.2038  ORF g.2038 m.2038 type:complete len:79 (-) comp1357_c0_seq1:136-372(-)
MCHFPLSPLVYFSLLMVRFSLEDELFALSLVNTSTLWLGLLSNASTLQWDDGTPTVYLNWNTSIPVTALGDQCVYLAG